ncbi:GIN domain-containing protein [Brumimicrobium aurantiacum]|uniref:Putative auto-transporter adhesin head GIN domain-containing protein n=1 Tax=Brumimicrobium aurantiacum TaxID=1737063 RepID=A0A3E1EUJ3_9FLAO|nr:DUF2807 domain-containing protein [Brumimicrobium aurantiacum]RFC53231.1 hypothetical protein DXU93_14280 [Brumimicrobium aurantiacum]
MKGILIFIVSFIILSNSFAQESTVYELSKFEKLVVIGNFPVQIINSSEKEAIVDKDDNDVNLENLTFSYSQNTLTIKYSGSFVEEIGINLTLYYAGNISTIEARRGAQIKVKNAGEFNSTVSYLADAGGKLEINEVYAPLIKSNVTKGGSISINGKTPIFEPTIKAGGTIAAVRLRADEVNANVTFGGEIICAPIQSLNANVTSGGIINYNGHPKVNKNIKLGGTIEKL